MASESDKPTAQDADWQPESPVARVQEAAAQQATGWKQARNQIMDRLIAEGVPPKRAARVAEATVRRAQAREGHTVFHYADVEQEFEQRARQSGTDPRRIEAGKRRIYTAARATAETKGVAVEEALFFCYTESLDVQSEFLVAVAAEDVVDGKGAGEEPAAAADGDSPSADGDE